MKRLRRISQRATAAGLERRLLRRMPALLLWTLLLPSTASILIRVLPFSGTASALEKRISKIDIMVIASVVTLWTALLTITLGCILVALMKGPGFVADRYDLPDPSKGENDRDEDHQP